MSFNFIQDINKKIHFIGIGGISMSGLAEILLEKGYCVSGSDMKTSPLIDKLIKKGATVYIGHAEENIKNVDLIVYTAAVNADNPELTKGHALGIPSMDRADFLGHIMKGHQYNIAISGTHGKTTTTSMVSHIVLEEALDPTILVGGELDVINGNVLVGNSEYFITEACEYKASFLKFHPFIGTILNIDLDHLDFYRDLQHIQDTFKEFIDLIPKEGYLVACYEDPKIKEILSFAKCNLLTYGFEEGDLQAKNVTYNEKGCASFDVYKNGVPCFTIHLNVPGKHNVLNALASIGVALSLSISQTSIVNGLKNFGGTHRRFEIKGTKNGVTVIDDYAHHPTEIMACLSAAKNYPHNKLYCVFQPHTFSRTITLLDGFSKCFYDTDQLILADIYAAAGREKDTHIISSDILANKISENNVSCINIHSFEEIVEYLNKNLNQGDLLMTVGAGDIYKVGEMYLEK